MDVTEQRKRRAGQAIRQELCSCDDSGFLTQRISRNDHQSELCYRMESLEVAAAWADWANYTASPLRAFEKLWTHLTYYPPSQRVWVRRCVS